MLKKRVFLLNRDDKLRCTSFPVDISGHKSIGIITLLDRTFTVGGIEIYVSRDIIIRKAWQISPIDLNCEGGQVGFS